MKKNIFKTLIATGVATVAGIVTFKFLNKKKEAEVEDIFEDEFSEENADSEEKSNEELVEKETEVTKSDSEEKNIEETLVEEEEEVK